MRYINLRFTYLLTNLRTGRTVERRTGKFAGERPTLYRCATQPTNQQAGIMAKLRARMQWHLFRLLWHRGFSHYSKSAGSWVWWVVS